MADTDETEWFETISESELDVAVIIKAYGGAVLALIEVLAVADDGACRLAVLKMEVGAVDGGTRLVAAHNLVEVVAGKISAFRVSVACKPRHHTDTMSLRVDPNHVDAHAADDLPATHNVWAAVRSGVPEEGKCRRCGERRSVSTAGAHER